MVYLTCLHLTPYMDTAEAKQLIKEIASSISKISEDRLVVVSLTHSKNGYEKLLLPIFDKGIEITNDDDIDNNSKLLLQIKVVNNHSSNIKKEKEYCSSSNRLITLEKSGLLLVPPR